MVPKLSPYDEAINALSELKNENLDRSGHVKLYYTRLNDILENLFCANCKLRAWQKQMMN